MSAVLVKLFPIGEISKLCIFDVMKHVLSEIRSFLLRKKTEKFVLLKCGCFKKRGESGFRFLELIPFTENLKFEI